MILTQINEAKSIYDLIPMLRTIELTAIQDILTQNVKKMDATQTSSLFCSSLSIEKILPIDIIEHITTFQAVSKAVSKTFNKCYQQSQKREIKKREKYIASKLNIDDKNTATTYVVDPIRTKLNENEQRLKYHGPWHDLSQVIEVASNGDTILMGNGTYGSYDGEEETHLINRTLNIDKCLRIIGTGDNV
eukprot:1121224_1